MQIFLLFILSTEISELAKTAKNDYLAQKTTFCITITYNYIKDFKIANILHINSYERSFVIEYQLYKKNNGTKILLRKKGSIKAVWGIEPNKKVCFWDERFNKNLTLEEYFYLLKV